MRRPYSDYTVLNRLNADFNRHLLEATVRDTHPTES